MRPLFFSVVRFVLVFGSFIGLPAAEPMWKAGVAVTNITPREWLWMGGYAARTRPAEGMEMELRLKALALEDSLGKKGLIITSDLLGFPLTIASKILDAIQRDCGLTPDQVILASSHTHCGPVLRESAMDMYDLNASERGKIERYSRELEAAAVGAAKAALSQSQLAHVFAGQGTTRFAVNRRNNTEKTVPDSADRTKLNGPSDHSVPVMSVVGSNGTTLAVLFGYACHNTVLDYYKWSGDYSGYAQLELERSHPGSVALFFCGCGGDQNPLPRRQVHLAERYGRMLAAAVEETLVSPMRQLEPRLRTAQQKIDLALGDAPTRSDLEKLSGDTSAPPTNRRWAARLLTRMDTGSAMQKHYPYPVQAWRLGERQLLITLGGEPVVDYALKFKKEFGEDTWVAGYCNDVMGYIPSLRVLKEDAGPPKPGWGYEGARSMMVYGLPAWRWSEQVENQVTDAARRVVEQTN